MNLKATRKKYSEKGRPQLAVKVIEMDAHIHYTPMKEYSRIDYGERYCFHCRKRRKFTCVIYVPTDPYSYYGPTSSVKCDVCGETDADLFPGRYRQDED